MVVPEIQKQFITVIAVRDGNSPSEEEEAQRINQADRIQFVTVIAVCDGSSLSVGETQRNNQENRAAFNKSERRTKMRPLVAYWCKLMNTIQCF